MRRRFGVTRALIENARDKRPEFGVIHFIDGERLDLRVGQSKNVIRNVPAIGDITQASVGDTVQLAWWDSRRPVAIINTTVTDVEGRVTTLEERMRAVKISKSKTAPVAKGGLSDWMILRFQNGSLASTHEPTEAGMQDALDLCVPKNLILVPSIELTMDVVVPTGVQIVGHSRYSTVIYGQVTMGPDSSLETMRILNRQMISGDVVAVLAPESGKAVIDNCDLWAVNCGGGAAYGFYSDGAGSSYLRKSFMAGETRNDIGVGVKQVAGYVELQNTQSYGDLAMHEGTVHVLNDFEGDTQFSCGYILNRFSEGFNNVRNPAAFYAIPSTVGDASDVIDTFAPLYASDEYVFGAELVTGSLYAYRFSVHGEVLETSDPIADVGSVYSMSVVTDDLGYIIYQDVDDAVHIYSVDFMTLEVALVATLPEFEETIESLHLITDIVNDTTTICVFGITTGNQFFHIRYLIETNVFDDYTLTDPDDDVCTLRSQDISGVLNDNHLICTITPQFDPETPLREACLTFMDVDLSDGSLVCTKFHAPRQNGPYALGAAGIQGRTDTAVYVGVGWWESYIPYGGVVDYIKYTFSTQTAERVFYQTSVGTLLTTGTGNDWFVLDEDFGLAASDTEVFNIRKAGGSSTDLSVYDEAMDVDMTVVLSSNSNIVVNRTIIDDRIWMNRASNQYVFGILVGTPGDSVVKTTPTTGTPLTWIGNEYFLRSNISGFIVETYD